MIKGYKVFNPDWTCRGFQYEVGKTYTLDDKPILCKRGFHFCENLIDCFDYYTFNGANKVAEIIAHGIVDTRDGEHKSCTNKIEIVRELSWEEVLRLVNTGDYNSGNCNSGNYNSGNCNSGDYNSGNRNSGNCNSGDYNSGDHNTGNCNSGDYNSGNRNSGNCNSGYRNAGDYNSGNRNSGNYNSGNRNSGDYNAGNGNNGCFCTEEATITMFDKPTSLRMYDWRRTSAYRILLRCPYTTNMWVDAMEMTDEEKRANPDYEKLGGFLKLTIATNEDKQKWWENLSTDDKREVLNLPNFDAEKFKICTGIDVTKGE